MQGPCRTTSAALRQACHPGSLSPYVHRALDPSLHCTVGGLWPRLPEPAQDAGMLRFASSGEHRRHSMGYVLSRLLFPVQLQLLVRTARLFRSFNTCESIFWVPFHQYYCWAYFLSTSAGALPTESHCLSSNNKIHTPPRSSRNGAAIILSTNPLSLMSKRRAAVLTPFPPAPYATAHVTLLLYDSSPFLFLCRGSRTCNSGWYISVFILNFIQFYRALAFKMHV